MRSGKRIRTSMWVEQSVQLVGMQYCSTLLYMEGSFVGIYGVGLSGILLRVFEYLMLLY